MISHDLDGVVEGSLKISCTFTEKVPNLGAREMTVEDIVHIDVSGRVGKVELLVQVAVLVNVHGNLLLHVQLTTIYLVGDSCAQMLQTCHPRKRISTQ